MLNVRHTHRASNYTPVDSNAAAKNNVSDGVGQAHYRDAFRKDIKSLSNHAVGNRAGLSGASNSNDQAEKYANEKQRAIQQELDQLVLSAKQCQAITQEEQPLFEYLLMRAVAARPIEGDALEALRRANCIVNETRKTLKYGRANVVAEGNLPSREAIQRVMFIRTMADRIIEVLPGCNRFLLRTAITLLMQAGKCAEYAAVALFQGGIQLRDGETLRYISGQSVDHHWLEMERAYGGDSDRAQDRIVVDAWCEGSAVMAEDSRFSHNLKQLAVLQSLNQTTLRNFMVATRSYLQARWAIHSAWEALKNSVDRQALAPHLELDALFSLTPVLSDAFCSQNKENVLNVFMTHAQALATHQNATEDLASRLSAICARFKLSMDIKAVGVARALGGPGIRQAQQSAAHISWWHHGV